MQKLNIALIGYGRMGKAIEQIVLKRGHRVCCIIDNPNDPLFASADFKSADVAIEFTSPDQAFANYLKCFQENIPVVSGTTGWLNDFHTVEAYCKEQGQTFFYASNFSLGVNLYFHLNKQLANLLKGYPEYTPHVHEIHHIHKLDAPSGTAITLAEDIVENSPKLDNWILQENASDDSEGKLAITHERTGEVPGTHEVLYRSEIDTISIKHEAHSREGFALGAVVAAEFAANHKGFLGMEDLLNLN